VKILKVLYSKNSPGIHNPVNHIGNAHKDPMNLCFENWHKALSVCMFLTDSKLHGFKNSREIQHKIPSFQEASDTFGNLICLVGR